MKDIKLYPKTIEELMEKLNYIVSNEENEDKVNDILSWIEWYNEQEYTLTYRLVNNEYLSVFIENDKKALQVWIHNEEVDSIKFNLLSNYYSDYDIDVTIVNE